MTSYLYIYGKKGLQRLVADMREALVSGAFSGTRLDDAKAELEPGDRVIFIFPESPEPKARCIGLGNVPITTGYDGTIEAVWDWVAAWDAPAIVDLPAHAWSAARNSLVRLSDAKQHRIQGGLRAVLGPAGALRLQPPLAPFSYYDIRGQRLLNDLIKDGKGNVPIPERNVARVRDALAKAHGAGQTLPCLFDAAGCFRFSFLVVGAMENVHLQEDGSYVVKLRDVQALGPPITRMGMRSFKTKEPVSVEYRHGALLIETPAELSARVRGPATAAGRPQGQPVAQAPAREKPTEPMTIFHFGYWGWGNHTPKLVETFDSIERARGYGPPVFVDIRISRQVRAQGFNGNAFGELLGDRYTWMKELGNPNIIGAQVDRSVDRPEAARDLLDLATKYWRGGRRVVFFCSCERVDGCHRAAVRDLLLADARRRKLDCVIVEWPGGTQTVHSLSVDPKAWNAALNGTNQLPLSDDPPLPGLTTMPWASVMKLECGPKHAWIITGPARFSNGRWRLPILRIFTEDESRPQEHANNMAAKMRKQVWGPAHVGRSGVAR